MRREGEIPQGGKQTERRDQLLALVECGEPLAEHQWGRGLEEARDKDRREGEG